MAEYIKQGRIEGSSTPQVFNGYWIYKIVLDLEKANPTTYNWNVKVYIKVGSYTTKVYMAENQKASTDPQAANIKVSFTNTSITNVTKYCTYGPITSNDEVFTLLGELSGTIPITNSLVSICQCSIDLGFGSSLSTGTSTFKTTDNVSTVALFGISPAYASNIKCVNKTSNSITMDFEVNWNGDDTTRNLSCILKDISGNVLQTISNGTTTATFTGLTRYTPYYIVGYASNSKGGTYTQELLIYTDPETPIVDPPTYSDLLSSSTIPSTASVKITPGVVTDDSGKPIEEIETYIKGGQYGITLYSLGKGTTVKTVTNLLPNTEYQIITRVSNGITEVFSEYNSFTTLGLPPKFTDIYASDIRSSGAQVSARIQFNVDYDYSSNMKTYTIYWRCYGDTSWKSLSPNSNYIAFNFIGKNTTSAEYYIKLTDSNNRVITSDKYVFTYVQESLDNEISNTSYTKETDDTYTFTIQFSGRAFKRICNCLLLVKEDKDAEYQLATNVDPIIDENNRTYTFKTKEFKNKRTTKYFNIIVNSAFTLKTTEIPITIEGEKDKNINLLDSSGSITNVSPKVLDQSGIIKELRSHDFIKLSRSMRYIDIDSKGTTEDPVTIPKTFTFNDYVINFSLILKHISGSLYHFSLRDLSIRGRSKTVRHRNNTLFIRFSPNSRTESGKYGNHYLNTFIFFLPIGEYTTQETSIDCSDYHTYIYLDESKTYLGLIPEYLKEFDTTTGSVYWYISQDGKRPKPLDVANNHLVNIKVIDKDGVDRAQGKLIMLTDGSNPIIYNKGDPTDGDLKSDKFIYSDNGLPLRLDLGQEYEIDYIEIQRRILNNNYYRNYIIGRNEDKEICYIFYDSNTLGLYQEENKILRVQ